MGWPTPERRVCGTWFALTWLVYRFCLCILLFDHGPQIWLLTGLTGTHDTNFHRVGLWPFTIHWLLVILRYSYHNALCLKVICKFNDFGLMHACDWASNTF
jgi:hypothetical protein